MGDRAGRFPTGRRTPSASATRRSARKAVLFAGLVAVEAWIWRRASRDRRDAMGAASLAAVATLAVFAPVFSLQVAAWLLPFAALAFEGDHDERHTAGVATVAIVLTGILALVWREQAVVPDGLGALAGARCATSCGSTS